ncbi:alpha/beta hydrolase [Ahrensia sp. R2A130]|uniref:alpha/beta hydrolase n=1 Tax=Ahrensia sp. R2A130 TaxID=744979 RepID=UPI0001E0CA34|nr:alpha/beta hydrolase fold domain-containing protein [Ahrensia sp. R2A130]EFL87878.1 alpha/beta hydrolase domain-containing protein [Ahrensia sp. R2A130]
MTLIIDPALFRDDAIPEHICAFNAELLATISAGGDMWAIPAAQVRANRLEGKGPFPLEAESTRARTLLAPRANGDGDIVLRLIEPIGRPMRGLYLHIHGGGWMLGAADAQDERLQEIAEATGLGCVSVDYRLAPEYPYPAGPDDCYDAARFLLEAEHGLPNEIMTIGGESAGAHLSVLTLLRLRDAGHGGRFCAANLTAGVYDLGQTASSLNWGADRLVLATRDMANFASAFLAADEDRRSPVVSPLFASLNDMPPALFSVGTKDLLLDDTLLMATRWHVANGNTELDVTPGGVHVFQSFRHLDIAQASNARIDGFLNAAANRKEPSS